MESKGLSPLPCYHIGEPVKILIDMLKNYNYIALGGMVPYSKKKSILREWLDKCFFVRKIINKEAKIHGFGMTAKWLLEKYDWYSVDSTGWLVARFGKDNKKYIKYFINLQKVYGNKKY